MSEERSWAEDTVALGRDEVEGVGEVPTPSRDQQRRRGGGLKAAALLAAIGVIVVLVGLLGGGGAGKSEGERTAPERTVTGEKNEAPLPMATGRPRTARHRAGRLAFGRGRPAPKSPQRSKPRPEAAPEVVEPEAAPVYEPAPEPVAAPEPTPGPSPSPAPETPAAVEFGM